MARRPGPRGLRPDEVDLWRQVADRTTPLHPRARAPEPDPGPVAAPPPRPAPPDLGGFRLGARAAPAGPVHDLAPGLAARLARAPLGMDAKRFARMKAGKLAVEGRIDLHGLTLDEAHPRLVRFILGAHAAGKRLVLVITGKGRPRDEVAPMPVRQGILKQQVPHWLQTGPLAGSVQQVTEAHRRHGGSGAYYVHLARGGK